MPQSRRRDLLCEMPAALARPFSVGCLQALPFRSSLHRSANASRERWQAARPTQEREQVRGVGCQKQGGERAIGMTDYHDLAEVECVDEAARSSASTTAE